MCWCACGHPQGRTELQTFLRQCVEDVRKQIAEINGQSHTHTVLSPVVKQVMTVASHVPYAAAPARSTVKPSVSIDDFTAADREKTLSLLLSQDRVISLLYAKVRSGGWGVAVQCLHGMAAGW